MSGSPISLTLYNPANLKKDDLIRGFVARQPLLARLLAELRREGKDNAPQHRLILGQRGLGKTTLLRRLAFAVEDDAELSAIWLPLVFPEEQYNVSSLAAFWLNCVDALGDLLDRRGDQAAAQALDERVSRVRAARDGQEKAALDLLLAEAARLGRRFLLLVDNLDIVFDRIRSEEWAFRSTLSSRREILIVGASSRALEALYDHGRAFYDFFQIDELKGLNDEETVALLKQLAAETNSPETGATVEKQPARIKTIRVLTGGNPRTLVLLFRVLQDSPNADVQRDIDELLDLYTPLYKARFEELARQAQQVVDALALHWDPIPVGELAKRLAPLSVSQVSAQLSRLEDIGVVEKTDWFADSENGEAGGKKTAYQIAERFFNIWYLMRSSRRDRRRLLWLVKFLEVWFDRGELQAKAEDLLGRGLEARSAGRDADMALAMSEAVGDRHLRRNLESFALRALDLSGIVDLRELPPDLRERGERIQRVRALREQVCGLRRDWGGVDRGEFWRVLGGSPQLSLGEKEAIVGQLGGLGVGAVRELYGKLVRAEELLQANYRSEAGAVSTLYQSMACGDIADAWDVEGAVAVAKQAKCHLLPYIAIQSRVLPNLQTGVDSSETTALAWKEAEVALLQLGEVPGFEALAWSGSGNLHWFRFGDFAQAEEAYRRAIELEPKNALPWTGLGVLLQDHLGRYAEAEEAYRRAIELDPKYALPWYNLGILLEDHLSRYAEAEEAYRRAIELDPKFAFPWNGLGNLLQVHLSRYAEAEEAYRRGLALDPKDAAMWHNLGLLFEKQGRTEEAAWAYLEAYRLEPANWKHAYKLHGAIEALADSTGQRETALALAQSAYEINPDQRGIRSLLVELLTLNDRWSEAAPLLAQLADGESEPPPNRLFRAVVAAGHTAEALAALEQTGAHERWRPLYEALRAVRAGDPEYLRRVAVEVRTVARRILAEIAPGLGETDAPKPKGRKSKLRP